MKRLIGIAVVSVGLVGCATPQQNAALAGAIVGATVMSAVHAPMVQHAPPTYHVRPIRCTYVRGGGAGFDAYGNPMFKYHKVCN